MTRSTPSTTTVSDVGSSRTRSMLPKPTDPSKTSSWYEALAKAWGQVVDDQANAIEGLADRISGGDDKPSTLMLLTAASSKMQFTANSASTSLGSVGNSLETMARKS